jgi:hypothetical protein
MADEADIAQARMERELGLILGAKRATDQPEAIGRCHYCDEDIGSGLVFCGSDCRDDWQREKRLRQRQGRQVDD